ncbi:MAG: 1-(5-phosphoribosyl)-5-[(5-phosphoribosylamino)methylideneamino] imidazole-4-carboxamide isomerase [Acidobacteriia bacterium]|nr:1-(5-phosphoribosyl)-5-[(5-phosphoribosylamino)methylideneamino] imidazole-4-carboxamide isomerase [Terriglobia bacterium]
MLIPSIDLMGGKIVQLVQGERKALEFSDFDYWIERFTGYSVVQLIDLDGAMGKGSNRELLQQFTSRLRCQVGGGIRSVQAAQEVLAAGAQKIIVGSALVRGAQVNTAFAKELAQAVGTEQIVAALDARGGKVAVHGWRELAMVTPITMLREVERYCGGFLYTHIETEGLMQGIPLEAVRELRAATSRRLIVAGGVRSLEEVETLDAMGVDAVVGMAIYTGQMKT